MKTINPLVLALFASVLGLLLQACSTDNPGEIQSKADHLYTGGKLYTSNPEAPWAEAMAVKGDRILYVGSTEGADGFINANTRIHNLNGQMVLPGLIDAHAHPGNLALYNQWVALPEAKTLEQQLKDIAQLLKDQAGKEVVMGIGWDNIFFDKNGPTREMLDQLDNTRPVLLYDITMHSLWVNSKALEQSPLGVNPEDPVPGVAYFKRDKAGQLTGYITESAATLFTNPFYKMGFDEEKILFDYTDYLSKNGITALFDAGNFGLDDIVYAAVKRLDEQGRLAIRYHGSYTLFLPKQLPGAIGELKRMAELYNTENLRIDTLKVFYDGVIETHTAHLLEDYSDTPGNRGGSLFGEQEMLQLILDLEQEGFNLHVHTVGDQAVRAVLNAVEQARDSLARPLTIQVALTHLQVIDAADFKRFRALDVIAQFTPAWHGNDDEYYAAWLGERANHPYPVAALIEQGATINFSSDVYFPSEWEDGSASPFHGIQVGHTRSYPGDETASGPASEQLGLEVMLQGYTLNGARQLSRQQDIGSLVAGKKADFIVLKENLFTMDKNSLHTVVPAAVVFDGELVQGAL